MESLTRLVSESFARHGFDRPLDYRRLHWSRWFPCESPRSLLLVPSKPGVFALAEEIMELRSGKTHVGAAAAAVPPARSAAEPTSDRLSDLVGPGNTRFDFAASTPPSPLQKRMLAVLQFCEDDDMAFVLDRMFSRQNPMRARLAEGRCFVRFVVLEDQSQRRNICTALNQWLISASEVTTGIGAHFSSSLELTDQSVERTLLSANIAATTSPLKTAESTPGTHLAPPVPKGTHPSLDSGAAANIHCPSPFPSGF